MRWKMKAFSVADATRLAQELGLHSIAAGVLTARGLSAPDKARAFINPSLAKEWSKPEDIAGISEIAKRLKIAIEEEKRICIFGDYDVDGITASTIMSQTIKELGGKAFVVLPLRWGEGYGLSESALERVYELEPNVLLTVDCGVSGAAEVAELLSRGIEVLITDHHEGSDAVPQGVYIADPKLDAGNPAGILAGAGVALKLAAALGACFGKEDLWKHSIDLAALGTIADCMPLTGENRALVAEGLKQMSAKSRTSITVALESFGRNEGTLTAQTLSFGLIPRLNAAGRVSDPAIAYDLLSADDAERAYKLAYKLDELNTERKELEARLYEQATEQIASFKEKRRCLVVGGTDWHDGVKGIAAGRLAREYGVPAVVFSFEDGLAVGSGRSVGTLDLHKVVSKLSDMFIKFGGHKSAIGLTIEQKRLDEFAKRLEDELIDIPPEQFELPGTIDCMVGLELLTQESIEELSMLEPFGEANPEPVLFTRNVMIKDARTIGKGNNHLSFVVSDGYRELSAVWFNTPHTSLQDLPAQADIVYRAQVEEWRGRKKLKLFILDVIDAEATHESTDDHKAEDTLLLHNLLLNGSQEEAYTQLASVLSNQSLTLRKSQLKCLSTLSEHKSTLAIMATGRGKSLIFQVYAAKLALTQKKPSLFIYPLRSLIHDQEYFLKGSLKRLGLDCASLTGSTPLAKREQIAQNIHTGSLQILLTTPEFIRANITTLDIWQEFSFVVVDEAHHIATSHKDFRPDYTHLDRLCKALPQAVFLALSATSDKSTTDAIVESLSISSIVVDTSKRPNLLLKDKRDTEDRLTQVTNIVSESNKSLVYVSSRGATIDLCKHLRKSLREKAHRIAFYNAALTPEDRIQVETAFRNDELSCIVATSAFGEGVNIPNVRDVVLYDMPYSLIDFNQMAGRAGRDGNEAFVHVLAHMSDATKLLDQLKDEQEDQGDGSLQHINTETLQEERLSAMHQLRFFSDWLFTASPHGLLSSIQRPLTPFEEGESA